MTYIPWYYFATVLEIWRANKKLQSICPLLPQTALSQTFNALGVTASQTLLR